MQVAPVLFFQARSTLDELPISYLSVAQLEYDDCGFKSILRSSSDFFPKYYLLWMFALPC